jgi:sugar fermentation stimulation protein A
LGGYDRVRPEVAYGKNSRIDLLLERDGEVCYVEVKNCTLMEDSVARFPDAVTARGLKHLHELRDQVREGCRAVMFFLVQRMDATHFAPADRIDPAYGEALREAVKHGVEAIVYDVALDLAGIRVRRAVPFLPGIGVP